MGMQWVKHGTGPDPLASQRELAEALTQYRGAITIQSLIAQANQNARDKSFYDPRKWDGDSYPGEVWNEYRHSLTNEQLLHAYTEMGEASKIYRKTGEFNRADLLEELADVWIVLSDLIGRYGLGDSFAEIIAYKLAKNQGRPMAYGNARAQAGISTPCCGEPGDCNEAHKGLC